MGEKTLSEPALYVPLNLGAIMVDFATPVLGHFRRCEWGVFLSTFGDRADVSSKMASQGGLKAKSA